MSFGESVRRRRKELGISQAELAARSGSSKAMVSEIESEKKNPTLPMACAISSALECQLSDLLDVAPPVRFAKLAPDQRSVLVDAASGIERHLVSPAMVRHGIQVLIFELPPGSSVDWSPHGRGAVEHATCILGRVRVWCGEASADLAAGESANFEPSMAHGFKNLDDASASRLFVVIDMSRRGEAGPMDDGSMAGG